MGPEGTWKSSVSVHMGIRALRLPWILNRAFETDSEPVQRASWLRLGLELWLLGFAVLAVASPGEQGMWQNRWM